MPSDTVLDAVLPAGGMISGAYAEKVGTTIKALVRFGEQTIVERTLALLRATGRIRRIAVVGPPEMGECGAVAAADVLLPATDSGSTNILNGLEWLREANGGQHAERVLIMTSDLPLVTAAALTGFLDACPSEADVAIPAIERRAFEARFPESVHTYVPLGDGEWMIGCTVLATPARLIANRARIDRVFAARKSDLAMGWLLGPSVALRFLMHRLTVPQIERRCAQLLGCTARAVFGCAPELGYDIDRQDEYEYAAERLGVG